MTGAPSGDTIFALSSGPPPAAIAIIRISGPAAAPALAALGGEPLPEPRRASLRMLRDAEGSLLDRALILLFPGPATATGEDLAELHLHGGRAVIAAVSRALAAMPGLRPAEAGEFTRRALYNGRVDLTEAEGLADLLSAQTESARRAALAMAGGAIRRQVDGWSDRLMQLSARIEAELDFADEDDVPAATLDELRGASASLAGEIDDALASPSVERVREGIMVVFAGPPNSGKSSLFNVLAGRDAAIVSPVAGTTRDRIEAWVERGGIGYTLVDTAGVRDDTLDPVERIGVQRARDAVSVGDIVLWLGEDRPVAPAMLWLLPQADRRDSRPAGRDAVSAVTGEGIDGLWRAIAARAEQVLPVGREILYNHRHRALLQAAAVWLASASQLGDILLMAEDFRSARSAFEQVTGRRGTEAMLDALFGRFCIGK